MKFVTKRQPLFLNQNLQRYGSTWTDINLMLLNPVKFKTLTTLGDRSFAAAAPQLWNSLPYAIRSSPSVASFKKTLKTFISESLFVILCAF